VNGAFAVVWGTLMERRVVGDLATARILAKPVGAGGSRSFGPGYIHDVRNASSMSTFPHTGKEPSSVDLILRGLYPITPESVSNHRYDNPTKVERSHALIEAGPFVGPQ
jgi:hypothetical protein